MTDRALEGVRIVEFTDELGSYCGRLLGDLGAEVIKVEPPGGGRQRHSPPFYRGQDTPDTSIAFWVQNTSKQSVVLDLEVPEDRMTAKALCLSAQIVLEDNPVGWMAARGLGWEQLRAEKPSLVYTSVTGFGQTGRHAGYAYADIVGQAMGGIMTLAGEPDDPPNTIYGHQADVSASIEAAQGTLLALLHAEATAEGQLVDVSAQESLSLSQETAMQTWDLQKRNRVRTGQRGAIPVRLPGLGVYECTDGYVMCFVLAPAGAEFRDMVDWMRELGKAEDLDQPPYADICNNITMGYLTLVMTNPAIAVQAIPALNHINEVVGRFFASLPATEAYEEGQRRRILNGLVSTPKDLAENKQLIARHWFKTLEFEYLGASVRFPGAPYRLSETPAQITRPPRLGGDTEAVLAALRGAT
jgi:benzylsuccinate CoA-transferase BbsE subunit